MKNKYELSRDIPDDVKYNIRKEAGFGCIKCGNAICTYEHIDPTFAEAKKHDATKMTYLCGACHDKVARGFMSKEAIWKAKRNPFCIQNKKCHDDFDISSKFYLWVGNNKINGINRILTIDDETILSIKRPEQVGAPFRLSAKFYDVDGNKVFEIEDNVWQGYYDCMDILCVGGRIGIRQNGAFVLKIFCFPPDILVIKYLDMAYKGVIVKIDEQQILRVVSKSKAEVSGQYLENLSEDSSFLKMYSDREGIEIGGGGIFTIRSLSESEKAPIKSLYSHKCRRNEPCPCGANKKYKHCCYPKYDYVL